MPYSFFPTGRLTWKTREPPSRYHHCVDITVDWGDGDQSRLVGDVDEGISLREGDGGGFRTVLHTYNETINATGGAGRVYEMKIAGQLMAWSFRDMGHGQENDPIDTLRKILYRVLDFGDMGWVDLSYAFKDAVNLVDVLAPSSGQHLSNVENMRGMFQMETGTGLSKVNPSTSNWDTSKVTDMSYMFWGATSANPDTSRWNTSSVTDMSAMFHEAGAANPDTSYWDVSRVQSMAGMFFQAWAANPLRSYIKCAPPGLFPGLYVIFRTLIFGSCVGGAGKAVAGSYTY